MTRWPRRAACAGLLLVLMSSACAPPAPTAGPPTSPVTPAASITPDRAEATGSATTAEPPFIFYLPWLSAGKPPATPTRAVSLPTSTAPAPPAASPVPTPAWPAPLDRLTNSKLGLHSIGTGDPYIMEYIRRARPRVVKSVGDVGWLSEVKAVSPDTTTIGKVVGWENDAWIETIDAAAAAEAVVDQQLAEYRLNPGVDYWEGWNEFVPINPARMRWIARFEATRVCKLQALGLRGAVGGFSVGVPEFDLMQYFLPALEAAQRCGGIFHLHEYNAPTMQCGVNGPNVPGIIPGAPALGVPAGFHTLRYRFWYEALLKPRGLGDLPLVISEAGVDKVDNRCQGVPAGAWKDYQGWWVERGIGPDGPQAYVNVMAWYDAELRRDPYVIGAAIFTAGAPVPGSGWHEFDLHDVLLPLAIYSVSLP